MRASAAEPIEAFPPPPVTPLADGAYRLCRRCIMDTSAEAITFDADGVCSFCKLHDALALTTTRIPSVWTTVTRVSGAMNSP